MSQGIDGSRLVAKGYGESYPIADNATAAAAKDSGQDETRHGREKRPGVPGVHPGIHVGRPADTIARHGDGRDHLPAIIQPQEVRAARVAVAGAAVTPSAARRT